MRTKIIWPTICTLLYIVGCKNPGVDSYKHTVHQAVNQAAQEDGLDVRGLVRNGDSPSFDSPALTIQCVDGQTCWINSPRILWQSQDGGKTWQEINRAPKDEDIESLDFVDGKTGWLIRFDKLYKSEDGGRTWAYQVPLLENPDGDLRSLWFSKDGKTGWLAGGQYRPQTPQELKSGVPNNTKDLSGKRVLEEAIFRTNDGGQTWQKQFSSGLWGRIMRIQFQNEQQGLALGERNIYYTMNAGRNWHQANFKKGCVRKEYLSDDYGAGPSNVAMLDAKTWWVAYEDGRIVKSIDGGREWCDLVHPGTIEFEASGGRPRFLRQIHFNSAEHGWGLGWDRFLYETKDGGLNWTRVSSEIGFDNMTFPRPNEGLLISDKGIYSLVL